MKPCADIDYTIGKDSYLLGTPDENAINAGCEAGEGVIGFQFSKMWEYEKVLLKSNLSLSFLMRGKLSRRTIS